MVRVDDDEVIIAQQLLKEASFCSKLPASARLNSPVMPIPTCQLHTAVRAKVLE